MARNITVIPAKQILTAESGTAQSVQKLKMAAYCRVSTDQEEQLLSYENQVNYYTNYISENPLYEYAGTYADEEMCIRDRIYSTVKAKGANLHVNICLPGMTSVGGSVGGENWCVYADLEDVYKRQAIGAAVVAAGVELVKLGDEYNKAVNQISASTGATGTELEELGAIAQKVYTCLLYTSQWQEQRC